MSRPIEIRLTDEQCDALKAEAEAAGLKFFDHCRAKLLAGVNGAPRGLTEMRRVPQGAPEHSEARRKVLHAPPTEATRLDRLEAMMVQMGETLDRLAHPMVSVEAGPVGSADVDDIVGGALAQLSPDEPLGRGYVEQSGDGVRPLGRRKPLPLAGGATPRHLAGLLPG